MDRKKFDEQYNIIFWNEFNNEGKIIYKGEYFNNKRNEFGKEYQ